MQRSLVFFIGFMLIDFLTCVVAFTLERHEDWSLLWPLLLQRFYYRQMMYVVLFRAVMGAVQESRSAGAVWKPRLLLRLLCRSRFPHGADYFDAIFNNSLNFAEYRSGSASPMTT